MQNVARPDNIDAIDSGLADDADDESDYDQIDAELAANKMENLEHELALALTKEEADGIDEEKEEEVEEHERMELEELIGWTRHMGMNDVQPC